MGGYRSATIGGYRAATTAGTLRTVYKRGWSCRGSAQRGLRELHDYPGSTQHLRQQGQRLPVVVLTPDTLPQPGATGGVGGRDSGKDGQRRRHAGRGGNGVRLAGHQLGYLQKLLGVLQPDRRLSPGARRAAACGSGGHGRTSSTLPATRLTASRRNSATIGSPRSTMARTCAGVAWIRLHGLPDQRCTSSRSPATSADQEGSSSATPAGRTTNRSMSDSRSPSPRAADPNTAAATGGTVHPARCCRILSKSLPRRSTSAKTASAATWSRLRL